MRGLTAYHARHDSISPQGTKPQSCVRGGKGASMLNDIRSELIVQW